MTSKEWIEAVLSHQAGPVPYNFMFSPPAEEALRNHYQSTDLAETLRLPIRMTGCVSIKPLFASPKKYGETIRDEFGVVWSTNEIDRGSPIGPSLPEPDLSQYTWPDPKQEYRFEGLDQWCARFPDHFTLIWVGDLWERVTFMRGMENALLDVALYPDFLDELLRGLTDYILQTMEVLLERYSFDAVAVSDDYGQQQGMIMSPDHWRKFIKPRLAEIYALAKKHNRRVLHHTCGHVVPIVGDLIDIGLDILHPIQPETMDILELKRQFGKELTFCGGIPTQDFLVHAKPDDVRDEVLRLKEKLGAGGGYILEPGITIQADVPLDNMVAMIEAAQET